MSRRAKKDRQPRARGRAVQASDGTMVRINYGRRKHLLPEDEAKEQAMADWVAGAVRKLANHDPT